MWQLADGVLDDYLATGKGEFIKGFASPFTLLVIADLLGIPVVRPAVIETTALGAAYLAGLSSGVYASTSELSHLWRADRRFVPTLSNSRAQELMANWEHAVRQTTAA